MMRREIKENREWICTFITVHSAEREREREKERCTSFLPFPIGIFRPTVCAAGFVGFMSDRGGAAVAPTQLF